MSYKSSEDTVLTCILDIFFYTIVYFFLVFLFLYIGASMVFNSSTLFGPDNFTDYSLVRASSKLENNDDCNISILFFAANFLL